MLTEIISDYHARQRSSTTSMWPVSPGRAYIYLSTNIANIKGDEITILTKTTLSLPQYFLNQLPVHSNLARSKVLLESIMASMPFYIIYYCKRV